ncbi:MAG: hlb protein [Benniella sp.]|nr:MAG: hlb protein [Benniella sp.]
MKSRITTSALWATLMVLTALTEAPRRAEAKNTTLNVLTDNVYFLTEILNWGQIIEECFAPCRILREGLKSQYPYQTPTLGHKTSELENGGVVIMSKWPIRQKHQFVFSGGCGTDRFANKGFVYARKNGDYIDFVFVDNSLNDGVQSVVRTVLKVHSPNFVLGRQVFGDFSDHFPVKAAINLSVPDMVDASDTLEQPQPQPQKPEQELAKQQQPEQHPEPQKPEQEQPSQQQQLEQQQPGQQQEQQQQKEEQKVLKTPLTTAHP